MNTTFVFHMKRSLSQVPTSGEANKCQRLFAGDEVLLLDDSDNFGNVESTSKFVVQGRESM